MNEAVTELATVKGLLDLAGLPASEHELEQISSSFPLTRRQIASLWAVTETRYAEPALVFQAEPSLAPWPAP